MWPTWSCHVPPCAATMPEFAKDLTSFKVEVLSDFPFPETGMIMTMIIMTLIMTMTMLILCRVRCC